VSKPRRWGLFASGRAAFGEKPASEREPGFEFDTFALTVGLDRRLGDDWVIGSALGVLDAAHDLSDGGELGVAARDFTLFGLWQRPSGFYAQASGTWGTLALDLERRVTLPRRGTETASATVDGDQLALALELGLGRELGAWSVNGFARASRVAADLEGYRERSIAAGEAVPLSALEVADQGVDSLLAEAGVDLAYTAHLRVGLLRPLVRVSLLHEAEDGARAIRSRLAIDPDPTNAFVVPTDHPDRDWASAGLGLQLYTLRGSVFLLVDRELARSDLETTRVTLGFRREF
jgi:outer membrane autotransporter protein